MEILSGTEISQNMFCIRYFSTVVFEKIVQQFHCAVMVLLKVISFPRLVCKRFENGAETKTLSDAVNDVNSILSPGERQCFTDSHSY